MYTFLFSNVDLLFSCYYFNNCHTMLNTSFIYIFPQNIGLAKLHRFQQVIQYFIILIVLIHVQHN